MSRAKYHITAGVKINKNLASSRKSAMFHQLDWTGLSADEVNTKTLQSLSTSANFSQPNYSLFTLLGYNFLFSQRQFRVFSGSKLALNSDVGRQSNVARMKLLQFLPSLASSLLTQTHFEHQLNSDIFRDKILILQEFSLYILIIFNWFIPTWPRNSELCASLATS